jgi:hypothetical protein
MNAQQKNAQKLIAFFERSGVSFDGKWGYRKFTAPGYMPLSVDRLNHNDKRITFSLAHNSVQNGDVMADPDMEVILDYSSELPTLQATTFQNDYAGVFNRVYDLEHPHLRAKLQSSLDNFLTLWLSNLHEQGHVWDGQAGED